MDKVLIFLAGLFFSSGIPASAQTPDAGKEISISKGLELNVILTPASVKERNIDPAGPFEVTGGKAILLQTQDNIFDLTAGRAIFESGQPGLEYFAVSPRNIILAIVNGKLGIPINGRISEMLELPDRGMKLAAAGDGKIFFYGGKDRVLYFMEGDRYGGVARFPKTVSCAITAGPRVFAASGNAIYLLKDKEKPKLAFTAPNIGAITSLAADPVDGLLYFATSDAVYLLTRGVAKSMVKGMGGYLKYAHPSLFVFDRKNLVMAEITGMQQWAGAERADREAVSDRLAVHHAVFSPLKDAIKLVEKLEDEKLDLESRLEETAVSVERLKKIKEESNQKVLSASAQNSETYKKAYEDVCNALKQAEEKKTLLDVRLGRLKITIEQARKDVSAEFDAAAR